ncbi:MAG: GDYXXLXY domain-containing protein [Defluviitaleaceae bacterium]|nr:GDYXXLXY domain-containing protein [Defluviitaleaceae bacterium]MCL2837243.1 GDYXXLXY domain-containing protein [Defluviitaleaceae bacterium]
MKKLLMPALIAVIIIQLLTPICMIANKYHILRTGEEFMFRVSPVDPYDAFRGRFVALNARQNVRGAGRYGVIDVDPDGFAFISRITDERPAFGAYVKSGSRSWFTLPIDRYYMEDRLAPRAELRAWRREPREEAYVTVRVRNGELIISGLFIDGIAIEDILRNE